MIRHPTLSLITWVCNWAVDIPAMVHPGVCVSSFYFSQCLEVSFIKCKKWMLVQMHDLKTLGSWKGFRMVPGNGMLLYTLSTLDIHRV